jgi:hypothetical protein
VTGGRRAGGWRSRRARPGCGLCFPHAMHATGGPFRERYREARGKAVS